MMNKKILMMSLAAVGFFAFSGNEGNASGVVAPVSNQAEIAANMTQVKDPCMRAGYFAYENTFGKKAKRLFKRHATNLSGIDTDYSAVSPATQELSDALAITQTPQTTDNALCAKEARVFFDDVCSIPKNCANMVIKNACSIAWKGLKKTLKGDPELPDYKSQWVACDGMKKAVVSQYTIRGETLAAPTYSGVGYGAISAAPGSSPTSTTPASLQAQQIAVQQAATYPPKTPGYAAQPPVAPRYAPGGDF